MSARAWKVVLQLAMARAAHVLRFDVDVDAPCFRVHRLSRGRGGSSPD
jgi:hypothetical protein